MLDFTPHWAAFGMTAIALDACACVPFTSFAVILNVVAVGLLTSGGITTSSAMAPESDVLDLIFIVLVLVAPVASAN